MNNKYIHLVPQLTAWLIIVLFVYTASDKLLNLKDFTEFLVRLDYIGGYGNLLAILIPVAEIGIALILLIPALRMTGLYMALGLMLAFTLYLIHMRLTRTHLPCHCGGAISKLTWLQHIWFNLGLMVLLTFSVLRLHKKTQTDLKYLRA